MQRLCKHRWGGLFAVLLAALAIGAARADTIFVTILPGQIGEYTTAGAVVNAAPVSGLDVSTGIAVSGSDLFVANNASGTIAEYDATTGTMVNAALVMGSFEGDFRSPHRRHTNQ